MIWQALRMQYVCNGEGQAWIARQAHARMRSVGWPSWLKVVTVQAVQSFQQLEETVQVRFGEQRIG